MLPYKEYAQKRGIIFYLFVMLQAYLVRKL